MSEFDKLKKLRSQSEETFMQSLKELELQYNSALDKVLDQEEQKIRDEEVLGEMGVTALEFERDLILLLVDCLYTSKGQVVYSEVVANTTEWFYCNSFIVQETSKKHRIPKYQLTKAFHLNFSD